VDASSLSIPPSLFWPIWQAVAGSASPATASSRRLSAFRAPTRSGPPGKLADLVVLSDDPMTCAEIQIRDITAEMTIVGGRVVHERGRSAA